MSQGQLTFKNRHLPTVGRFFFLNRTPGTAYEKKSGETFSKSLPTETSRTCGSIEGQQVGVVGAELLERNPVKKRTTIDLIPGNPLISL
jgi:hypothetical protein